jgi:hypothetical protein
LHELPVVLSWLLLFMLLLLSLFLFSSPAHGANCKGLCTAAHEGSPLRGA